MDLILIPGLNGVTAAYCAFYSLLELCSYDCALIQLQVIKEKRKKAFWANKLANGQQANWQLANLLVRQ